MYPRTEVHNLGRYLTIMKVRVLSWRVSHAYLVSDKFDVIETPEDPTNNTVSFFGYVRGTYLDKHNRVHLNGLGDFDIKSITKIEDPCPIEMKKTVKQRKLEIE